MSNESLKELALKNFDDLHRRGEILWTDTEPIWLESTPFQCEFRIAPSWKKKPAQSENDKGRTEATDPFGDDHPAFVISKKFDKHTLRLNKFCVVRPQFVLHTNEFEKQSDFLTLSDAQALLRALVAIGSNEYAALYNCGAASGSSIGHKHMQLIPKPSHVLFPDEALTENPTGTISSHQDVPFAHAILPIDTQLAEGGGGAVYAAYLVLCERLELVEGRPHNVFLTKSWIVVIPRSKAKSDDLAANAASMLGIIWVKDETELKAWKERGPAKVLTDVGVSR